MQPALTEFIITSIKVILKMWWLIFLPPIIATFIYRYLGMHKIK